VCDFHEQTLDIDTVEGKRDFVRNLVACNVILEGIWFYSGFVIALSFRQRTCLVTSPPWTGSPGAKAFT
jgi:ribonucleotide reductase beta subunit family protein with ferritin-like domain